MKTEDLKTAYDAAQDLYKEVHLERQDLINQQFEKIKAAMPDIIRSVSPLIDPYKFRWTFYCAGCGTKGSTSFIWEDGKFKLCVMEPNVYHNWHEYPEQTVMNWPEIKHELLDTLHKTHERMLEELEEKTDQIKKDVDYLKNMEI